MGLYGDKKDYEQLVSEHIKKAKLLYNLSNEERILVSKLLEQKEKIKLRNNIFANLKLKLVNNKIEKIKKNKSGHYKKWKKQNLLKKSTSLFVAPILPNKIVCHIFLFNRKFKELYY